MRAADHIIDVGPGAGINGGKIIAQGTVDEIEKVEESLTGQYLSGKKFIPVPSDRREPTAAKISIKGARVNNLKNMNVDIPLGLRDRERVRSSIRRSFRCSRMSSTAPESRRSSVTI